MSNNDSNKRLKSASGAPISKSSSSQLPAYQAPVQLSPDASRSSASIARPANGKTSLRLTVKAPPSKLRQATSGSQLPPNPYADTPSESDATPAPAPRAARATRNPRTVVEPDSEDDFDELDVPAEEVEDEVEEDEEDAEGEDETMLDNEDSEEDAEGDDEDMEDHPPPPVIRQTGSSKVKPNVTVSAPAEGPLKSVEDKEMEDDDDEELSELESDDGLGGEGEGEDDEEGDGLSDDDEDDGNSRSATPDLTKLTKRQRAAFEDDAGLLALSNEALKKKELTAEEHAMRRAEMARRRKNLSEKRNEEEKMDTINKLLKKPAPKRRTRAEMEAARAAEADENEDGDADRPPALYLRWVNNQQGSRIGVTEEWLDAPIGEPFRKPGGAMVQEVA